MNPHFKTLTKKLVYSNPWMQVYEHSIKRRDSTGMYGTVERPDAVIVIPLSPSRQTVILKQYRYPTDADSWELPMGGIDDGESPEEAARRELFEETGLQSDKIQKIGEYFAIPGLTPQRVYVYVANVSEEALAQASAVKDMDEIQEFELISCAEVFDMAKHGIISDGTSLVGLFYLSFYLNQDANGKV